jgi:hypothetical protein
MSDHAPVDIDEPAAEHPRRNAESPRAVGPVRIAASRVRACTRAVLWSTPALILGAIAWLIFKDVDLAPSGHTNRMVDWAKLVSAVPISAGAVASAFHTIRWLVFSLWPRYIGFEANRDGLATRLGPFGSRFYDARHLRIRYPFELLEAGEESDFEAYLPEEKQRRQLLPRIIGPGGGVPLNKTILRFVGLTEPQVVTALLPMIDDWRRQDPTWSESSEACATDDA